MNRAHVCLYGSHRCDESQHGQKCDARDACCDRYARNRFGCHSRAPSQSYTAVTDVTIVKMVKNVTHVMLVVIGMLVTGATSGVLDSEDYTKLA